MRKRPWRYWPLAAVSAILTISLCYFGQQADHFYYFLCGTLTGAVVGAVLLGTVVLED